MRSKLCSCPIRGWLNLAICTLAISLCFYSCTLSVDVNATPLSVRVATASAPSIPVDGGAVRRWFSSWTNWVSLPAGPHAGASPALPVVGGPAAR